MSQVLRDLWLVFAFAGMDAWNAGRKFGARCRRRRGFDLVVAVGLGLVLLAIGAALWWRGRAVAGDGEAWNGMGDKTPEDKCRRLLDRYGPGRVHHEDCGFIMDWSGTDWVCLRWRVRDSGGIETERAVAFLASTPRVEGGTRTHVRNFKAPDAEGGGVASRWLYDLVAVLTEPVPLVLHGHNAFCHAEVLALQHRM
jgi:hypothetical protein